MTIISKLLVVVLLYVPSSNSADCYWKGWPWCGLVLFPCSDNNDHHMQYGIKAPCFLVPDKYCCPSGSGADIALCEHTDLNGACISHSIDKNKCVNVDKNDWASSVNTFGGCFRLYEHADCEGKSIAVKPGSPSHNNLVALGMNDMVTSVSLCFSTDKCDHRSKRSNNNCQWANNVFTIGFLPWLNSDRNNLNGPISYYQIGPNSRTEVMEAHIYPHHLGTGTGTNQAARDYTSNMGNPSDDAGHILAARLGGSGTDLRNIFPQSRHINRGAWAREVEGLVALVVQSQGSAIFTINLIYEETTDTRPQLIVYRIKSGNYVWQIGDMVNPD